MNDARAHANVGAKCKHCVKLSILNFSPHFIQVSHVHKSSTKRQNHNKATKIDKIIIHGVTPLLFHIEGTCME